MSWIDVAGQLSRSGPAEVVHARRAMRDLVRPARQLLSEHACGTPGHAGCPFAGHPLADAACSLVPALAALDVAAPGRSDDPAGDLLAALADAGDAVRWCRTTAHPSGDCWFRPTTLDGDHCCGAVLRLVLSLGTPVRH